MEIPLQRKPQRNSYQSSIIAHGQAQRAFAEFLDNLEIAISDQIRQLQTIELQITLQETQIEQQRRAVTISEIQYESGDIENRDLLDARGSLTDARNGLIELQVNHVIGRLRLQRDLGLLFVNEKGMWK
jgi:outer membrane protein TolC